MKPKYSNEPHTQKRNTLGADAFRVTSKIWKKNNSIDTNGHDKQMICMFKVITIATVSDELDFLILIIIICPQSAESRASSQNYRESLTTIELAKGC